MDVKKYNIVSVSFATVHPPTNIVSIVLNRITHTSNHYKPNFMYMLLILCYQSKWQHFLKK
jgi:hypothetical protein